MEQNIEAVTTISWEIALWAMWGYCLEIGEGRDGGGGGMGRRGGGGGGGGGGIPTCVKGTFIVMTMWRECDGCERCCLHENASLLSVQACVSGSIPSLIVLIPAHRVHLA